MDKFLKIVKLSHFFNKRFYIQITVIIVAPKLILNLFVSIKAQQFILIPSAGAAT